MSNKTYWDLPRNLNHTVEDGPTKRLPKDTFAELYKTSHIHLHTPTHIHTKFETETAHFM